MTICSIHTMVHEVCKILFVVFALVHDGFEYLLQRFSVFNGTTVLQKNNLPVAIYHVVCIRHNTLGPVEQMDNGIVTVLLRHPGDLMGVIDHVSDEEVVCTFDLAH